VMFLVQLFFCGEWYYFQVFFSPLVTILMAPVIIGMAKHFIFHIHWISVIRLLYFNLLLVPFCITFLSTGYQ
jgi:hypothetical protein